jgi:hypothetical protein
VSWQGPREPRTSSVSNKHVPSTISSLMAIIGFICVSDPQPEGNYSNGFNFKLAIGAKSMGARNARSTPALSEAVHTAGNSRVGPTPLQRGFRVEIDVAEGGEG